MEDRQTALQKKRDELLKAVAEVEVELSRADGAIVGIPHYSVIETRAHELGRQLSREVQQRQMGELAVNGDLQTKCPDCGKRCDFQVSKRRIASIDGEFTVPEVTCYCSSCRRTFFPSA